MLPSILLELDVDTERTDFFDEDVEGFRHSGIHLVMPVDDDPTESLDKAMGRTA